VIGFGVKDCEAPALTVWDQGFWGHYSLGFGIAAGVTVWAILFRWAARDFTELGEPDYHPTWRTLVDGAIGWSLPLWAVAGLWVGSRLEAAICP